MAKKKVEEQEEVQVEAAPAPALQYDPVDACVAKILSFFPEINQVEGVPFDKDNPKHRLIAAWYIGRGGWLRK